MTHRWSGWPGAWCLDCGTEDQHEIAFAEGNFVKVDDPNTLLGFRYEFPNVKITECPEPGSNRYNPYHKA
jgi:hypothetical protein